MKDGQINELYIQSSKIMSVGSLLNFSTPDDFPTAGNDIYSDIGEMLVKSGQKIEEITSDLERENLKKRCE